MRFLLFCFGREEEVALLVPVLQLLVRHNSKLTFTVLCSSRCESFFYNIPSVHVIPISRNGKYRALLGVYRLFTELYKIGPFTNGIDFHGDLGTFSLRFLFLFTGLFIRKFRSNKRKEYLLTRRLYFWTSRRKKTEQLPHIVGRYFDAFFQAGIERPLLPQNQKSKEAWINLDTHSRANAFAFFKKRNLTVDRVSWVGIAPFTPHPEKNWPMPKTKEFIERVQKELGAIVFLFGGRLPNRSIKKDIQALQRESPKAVAIPASIASKTEMAILAQMDVFVSMDSLYMHLASLLGNDVISLWGPSHPYAGYSSYGQNPQNIVQISHSALPCRPCSLRGDKKCYRKDMACMSWISVDEVWEKVKTICQ